MRKRGVILSRTLNAEGGLPLSHYELLRSRPDLVNRIAEDLLDRSFEPSFHDDILDAVGIQWVTQTPLRRRDPRFRDSILRIYEHRCAICGYDGQLEHTDLGLEAAHVKWYAAGGPDQKDNGVAMCAFHHKAFDRGALGLDDGLSILVSQHVRGSTCVEELLLRFAGTPLHPPQTGEPPPAVHNVRWHRRQVFRAPARAGASA